MSETSPVANPGWRFDNTYARLPDVFFSPAQPARWATPKIAILNSSLGRELGLDLDVLSSDVAAQLFTGQTLPEGSQPIAQAYAGHQYGHFTMLGDGRAILLGEHLTPTGKRVDLQFKGSGPTQYSRRGDGRAALGPMLREYLISEAMAALGIPTTRSLAVATTGETVFRNARLPGAVLTRVADSHLRVGTFEYAARLPGDALRILADYAIARHDPDLVDTPDRYRQFLDAVVQRQADLIARWQSVGFIHGVMNTDNMAISGETIDYGPCAFMNRYDPRTVFSSIDHSGRYAYQNQPAIAHWNLARLAETLLPLLDPDQDRAVELAMESLNAFPDQYEQAWLAGMRLKLGLRTDEPDDRALVQSLLDWMNATSADFTNTFRVLSDNSSPDALPCDAAFQDWYARWQQRRDRQPGSRDDDLKIMRTANPSIIPRNHRVEEALAAAEHHQDFSVFHRVLAAICDPYSTDEKWQDDRVPSPDDDRYQTFCGT